MKKILFIIFLSLALFTTKTFAQDATEGQYIYCELVGTSKFMSSKVSVQIDFGQTQNFFKTKDARIRDEKGDVISFNSMVDALNYMGTQEWEFVQAYVVTNGNQNVYHWLLKKKLSEKDMEELKDMISKKK